MAKTLFSGDHYERPRDVNQAKSNKDIAMQQVLYLYARTAADNNFTTQRTNRIETQCCSSNFTRHTGLDPASSTPFKNPWIPDKCFALSGMTGPGI